MDEVEAPLATTHPGSTENPRVSQTRGPIAQEAPTRQLSLVCDRQAVVESLTVTAGNILIDTDTILQPHLRSFTARLMRQKDVYERTIQDLHDQLSEKDAQIDALNKTLLRAGRDDAALTDDIVKAYFIQLKGAIFQFVMNHCGLFRHQLTTTSSSKEHQTCILTSDLATIIHNIFFSPDSLAFGHSNHMGSQHPLDIVDKYLQNSCCDGKLKLTLPG